VALYKSFTYLITYLHTAENLRTIFKGANAAGRYADGTITHSRVRQHLNPINDEFPQCSQVESRRTAGVDWCYVNIWLLCWRVKNLRNISSSRNMHQSLFSTLSTAVPREPVLTSVFFPLIALENNFLWYMAKVFTGRMSFLWLNNSVKALKGSNSVDYVQ